MDAIVTASAQILRNAFGVTISLARYVIEEARSSGIFVGQRFVRLTCGNVVQRPVEISMRGESSLIACERLFVRLR